MSSVPAPLAVMRSLLGTTEAPGEADNQIIIGWGAEIGRRWPEMAEYVALYRHDATPWCGWTMGYVMARCGVRPPFGTTDTQRFMWAESWRDWGVPVEIDDARPGDVVVLRRHVTLLDRRQGDVLICIGGNQADQVKESRYPVGDVLAIRRAPADGQAVVKESLTAAPGRQSGITATVFGGASDPNQSAYEARRITDDELGVALPYRFAGKRPRVRVWRNGLSVDCAIVDVGPWNTHDPYWTTGARPQAESGVDLRGRRTNRAGIDLTPAAARAIGLTGKGLVDWEFVQPAAAAEPVTIPDKLPEPAPPPITGEIISPSDTDRIMTEIAAVIRPIVERRMSENDQLAKTLAAMNDTLTRLAAAQSVPTPTPIALPAPTATPASSAPSIDLGKVLGAFPWARLFMGLGTAGGVAGTAGLVDWSTLTPMLVAIAGAFGISISGPAGKIITAVLQVLLQALAASAANPPLGTQPSPTPAADAAKGSIG